MYLVVMKAAAQETKVSQSGKQTVNTDPAKQIALDLLKVFDAQIKTRQPIPSYGVDFGTKGRYSK